MCYNEGLIPPDVRAKKLAETHTLQPRRRTAGVNPAARGPESRRRSADPSRRIPGHRQAEFGYEENW